MRVSDLNPNEYAAFYAGYINKIPNTTLRSAMDESAAALLEYLTNVPDDRVDYTYGEGKWTIKESLQHIIDTERIFAYRALRIGRGDQTPLPGFEQNDFVATMDVSARRFLHMIEEFRLLRQANIILFESFTEQDLVRSGFMSGGAATTRGIGFIMCGHVFHHAELYREKYGVQ